MRAGVRILVPRTVDLMTTNQSGALHSTTGLGFSLGFETVDRYGVPGPWPPAPGPRPLAPGPWPPARLPAPGPRPPAPASAASHTTPTPNPQPPNPASGPCL